MTKQTVTKAQYETILAVAEHVGSLDARTVHYLAPVSIRRYLTVAQVAAVLAQHPANR